MYSHESLQNVQFIKYPKLSKQISFITLSFIVITHQSFYYLIQKVVSKFQNKIFQYLFYDSVNNRNPKQYGK